MCLYPKIIQNRKYTKTKKNGGVIPTPLDKRVMGVTIGCGRCIECMKKKKREWQVRMQEEIKTSTNAKFVTLTFSEEALEKIKEKKGIIEANAVAKYAVRKFTGRWIDEYKKTIRHWLITELGHKGTERLHLHGIVWTNESNEDIERKWKYGHIWVGEYVNEKTINYIVKYVTKKDIAHEGYQSIILCSPGIGRGYENKKEAEENKYKEGGKTKERYRLNNGAKIPLPIYYRNKIYSEEEREKLWIEKLDENRRFVLGEEIKNTNTREGSREYMEAVEYGRTRNITFGYESVKWNKKEYIASRKLIEKELEKISDEKFGNVINNIDLAKEWE